MLENQASPNVSPSGRALLDSGPQTIRPSLFVSILITNFGAFLGVFAPSFIALSISVATLAPHNKLVSLGIVLAPAAIVGMFSPPLLGRLSDRTTWSFGRRRSWILICTVLGITGLWMMSFAPNIAALAVGWCVTQVFLNGVSNTALASIPDFVPQRRQVAISSLNGIVLVGSQVIAVFLVIAVAGTPPLMYLVPAVCVAVTSGWALWAMRKDDRPTDRATLKSFNFLEFVRSFYVNPISNRDYALVWCGRLLLYMGYFTLVIYQLYYVTDHLLFEQHVASNIVGNATLLGSAAAIVGSLAAGAIAARMKRLKIVVVVAGTVVSCGLLVLATGNSQGAFLVASGVMGLGQGIYLSVDMAIVSQSMKDPAEAGRDMGVLNIAITLPQCIIPIIAPAILAIGGAGPNYPLLYLGGAGFALAGGVIVVFVRKVR